MELPLRPLCPELNSIAVYGSSVLVGGSSESPGQIWKYTPDLTNHLPRLSTGFALGERPASSLSGLGLSGSATDADGDTLSFSWKARGPGTVTFADPAAASTTASFSATGDYVLTLLATDGSRSAGAPVIVVVSDSP